MKSPCPGCGAARSGDERYCLNCGTRLVGPILPGSFPPPTAARTPGRPAGPRGILLRVRGRRGRVRLPNRRGAAVLVAGVLVLGVLMGITIRPVAASSSGDAPRPRVVAMISPPPPTTISTRPPDAGTDPNPGGDSGSIAGAASNVSVDTTTTDTATTDTATTDTTTSDTTSFTVTTSKTSSTETTTTTRTTTPLPRLNLRGVVVSTDEQAQSFALVDGAGRLHSIHTNRAAPPVGSTVELATRELANGTLEATRSVTDKGAGRTAVKLSGVVSFVDPAKQAYAVSSRGVSLLIAASSTSAQPLPVVGRDLKLSVRLPGHGVAPGRIPAALLEQTRADSGASKPPLELAGVLTSIDSAKRRIGLSADGPNKSGETITLAVPRAIDLAGVVPLEAVLAHAVFRPDGSYVLTGIDSDSGITGAGDPTNALGDFRPLVHATRSTRAQKPRRPGGATSASQITLYPVPTALRAYPTLRQGANAFLEPASAGASSG